MSSLNIINSGLDVQSIVDQLIYVERAPIRRLETQNQALQSRIKAFQSLNTKLSALLDKLEDVLFGGEPATLSVPYGFLQRFAKSIFAARRAASSDDAAVAVTAGKGGTVGSYAVEVSSLARAETSASANFADTDTTTTGTGTLVIQIGSGEPVTITVDESNNTPAGIRDAINAANAGVSATIINDGSGSPYRLLVTSRESGTANAFTVTDNLTGGQALNLVETQAATDAQFTVNGISLTKSSNLVSDVITGITLTLKSTTASPVEITVEKDPEPVVTALKGFIDAYNELNTFANAQSRYDADSKTAGVLSGDPTLRSVLSRIGKLLTMEITNSYTGLHYASQLGLRFNNDGSLSLDEAKFREALESDTTGVAALFLGDGVAGAEESTNVSDSRVTFNSRTAVTLAGTYDIEITGLAQRASVTGTQQISTLAQDETLTVTCGGTQAAVNLSSGDDLAAVLNRINTALAAGGISATAADNGAGRIEIATSGYGSGESVTVVSDTDGLPGSAGFGTTPVTGTGVDISGTINGNAAIGNGLRLIGASGNPEEGLNLTISQTVVGTYGTVTLSAATAAVEGDSILVNLNRILRGFIDPRSGLIHRATEGLNDSMREISRHISEYEDRLDARREQLLMEYTRADQALRLLQVTQNSLGNQLDNLAKLTQA